MTLAERVKATRRARGWSREQLAVYSNVSASTIGRIERGEHTPRASALISLAQALGIPIGDLAAEAGVTIHIPPDKWS